MNNNLFLAMKVNDLFDFIGMEDDDRSKLLSSFNKSEVLDIANFCNSIQILDIEFKFNNKNVKPSQSVTLLLNITKEGVSDYVYFYLSLDIYVNNFV